MTGYKMRHNYEKRNPLSEILMAFKQNAVKQLIFLLMIIPTFVYSQNATFYADTGWAFKDAGNDKKLKARLMEMEWKIRGKTLHFGSEPIEIKPIPGKIDTLFYKHDNNADWDTILCMIKEPRSYKFIYNVCCGGFDVAGENKHRIQLTSMFRIKGMDNNHTYLGTLGEAGIIVNSSSADTLRPGCRSAMSPNIFEIGLSEIEICRDTNNCYLGHCLFEKGKELAYEFAYRTISEKLKILYMPLSENPVKVIYDPNKDRIKLE